MAKKSRKKTLEDYEKGHVKTPAGKDISEEVLQMEVIPNNVHQIKFRIKDQFPQFKNKEGPGTTEWAYGRICNYHDDADAYWAKDRSLVVADAIRDKDYLINPKYFEIVEIPFDYDPEKGHDEYTQFVEDEFEKAQKLSNESPTLVNKIFRVGVADGYACYIVTAVTKTRATIERRKFCMDDWADQYLGYGGTFNRDRIEDMVDWEESRFKFFEKAKETA
jgi:hypothetical protein